MLVSRSQTSKGRIGSKEVVLSSGGLKKHWQLALPRHKTKTGEDFYARKVTRPKASLSSAMIQRPSIATFIACLLNRLFLTPGELKMTAIVLLATGSVDTSSTPNIDLRTYVANDAYIQLELRLTAITSNTIGDGLVVNFMNQGTAVTASHYSGYINSSTGLQTGQLTGTSPPVVEGASDTGSDITDGSGTIVLRGFCSTTAYVGPSASYDLATWAHDLKGDFCVGRSTVACANASNLVFDGLNFTDNGSGKFTFNWALYGITSATSEGSSEASCNYATTGALPANTYNNGTSGVGATLTANANGALTVDGSSVSAGQRILVWQEVTSANNGIYVVTNAGSGGAAYILTRASDFNGPSTIQPGVTTYIQSGTAYAKTNFQMTTAGTITVGTTNIVFSELGGGGGTVTLTGDVTGSGTGSIATTIAANAVANSKLAQMASHTYKGNNTGSTANAADTTSTQLTADLNLFTSSLQGLAPGSGGGTTNFLRADGSWAAPTGGGGGGTVPYLQIGGLLISSIAGTHTTASFNTGAGGCADLTGAAYISVSSTLSWKASNGNAINGTDASSSTLANSTSYHVFVCTGTSGTGSFVSASLTPTFPTGYNTYSRRIGSFTTTSAGAPIPYTSIETYGGATRNYLTTQVLDQGAAAVTTSARTLYTLGSIPTGIKMRPVGRWLSYGAATSQFIVTSPDETDIAPASYTSPGTLPGWDSSINSTTGVSAMFNWDLTTNTSAQIGGRGGSTSASFSATTRGWDDFRRS